MKHLLILNITNKGTKIVLVRQNLDYPGAQEISGEAEAHPEHGDVEEDHCSLMSHVSKAYNGS
jgi:hypothetical protein